MSGNKIPAMVETFYEISAPRAITSQRSCDENNDQTLAGEDKLCEVPSEKVQYEIKSTTS